VTSAKPVAVMRCPTRRHVPPSRGLDRNLSCHQVAGHTTIRPSSPHPVLLVPGSFAYFVTSAKPAVVMRCPIKEMFHGDTFHPLEVETAPFHLSRP
jgi:hypothetical protein